MFQDHEPRVIVVGVDGSRGAWAALRWACAQATALGAVGKAVHAWVSSQPGERVGREVRLVVRGLDRPPPIRYRTVQGAPAAVLVAVAAATDLLVLGGREPSPGRVAVGTVALTCRRTARCPVAIIDCSGRRLPGTATILHVAGTLATRHQPGELQQALTDIAAGR